MGSQFQEPILLFLPIADGWKKMFFEKSFTQLVYVQHDQRVMGITVRYVCWGTPLHPSSPGALSDLPHA